MEWLLITVSGLVSLLQNKLLYDINIDVGTLETQCQIHFYGKDEINHSIHIQPYLVMVRCKAIAIYQNIRIQCVRILPQSASTVTETIK